MSHSVLNAVANSGFSGAESYDVYRPSYNPLAVQHILDSLNLTGRSHARVLELASGTGKFTSLISSRDENFEIIAVEPHQDMVRVLRKKALPRVEVKEGNSSSIPVDDNWAEALIVAQAFHWFATRESLLEFARVLKPMGSIGFIWNVEDYNQAREFTCATSWEGALRDLNWKYTTDGIPRFKNSKWRTAFYDENGENLKFLQPIKENLFRETAWLTKETLWNRLGTLSNIFNLKEKDKVELKVQFDNILETALDLVQNERGGIQVHSTCVVSWTSTT